MSVEYRAWHWPTDRRADRSGSGFTQRFGGTTDGGEALPRHDGHMHEDIVELADRHSALDVFNHPFAYASHVGQAG